MKFMNMALAGTLVVSSAFVAHNAQAHGITRAKAAELAFHRVERLVILKKIEESFQSKLQSVTLEALPHQTEDQPNFKATVYQHPGTDGTQKSIEILLNGDGKALKHTVTAGTESTSAPVWPDRDATTLSENALHYVLEGSVNDPKLAPFNANLSRLKIRDGLAQNGERLAVVELESEGEAAILRIRMKLDGSIDSSEIVNR